MLCYQPSLTSTNNALSLLLLCDNDFTPSLSSSRLIHCPSATQEDKIKEYLREKQFTHQYLLLQSKNDIQALMNFTVQETVLDIDTFCVHPNLRNQGIGHQFYEHIFSSLAPALSIQTVSVWCNRKAKAHLYLLDKLGFKEEGSSPVRLLYTKRVG